MSLNHKRRIFRASPLSLPSLGARLPSLGLLLAFAGGTATLILAASLFVRSSEAPAHAPVSSQLSAGPDHVAVLDAETIKLGDQLVQLEAIAAPPRGSRCHNGGPGEVDCGVAAATALASMLRGSSVTCTIHGNDGRGRPVGTCLAAGRSLNQALVLDGWARASASALRAEETSARAAGRGIWRIGS